MNAASATRRRVGVNTAIFALATALSRIAGLGARGRRGGLLRHDRSGVGVHARVADPEPDVEPVRAGGAVGGVRAGVHRSAAAGTQARGVQARLDAVLDHPDRARRAHRAGDPAGRRDHAAVHGHGFSRGRQRADRGADAGAVPGRAAARPDRADGRDPAVLRPVHDPGDRAGGLEPRDPRAADRPAPPVLGQIDLRVRGRVAGGHRGADADGRLGAAEDRLPPRVHASTGETLASNRSSC